MDFSLHVAGQDGKFRVKVDIGNHEVASIADDIMSAGLDVVATLGSVIDLDGRTVWSIATMLNHMVIQTQDWSEEKLSSFSVGIQDSTDSSITQH